MARPFSTLASTAPTCGAVKYAVSYAIRAPFPQCFDCCRASANYRISGTGAAGIHCHFREASSRRIRCHSISSTGHQHASAAVSPDAYHPATTDNQNPRPGTAADRVTSSNSSSRAGKGTECQQLRSKIVASADARKIKDDHGWLRCQRRTVDTKRTSSI